MTHQSSYRFGVKPTETNSGARSSEVRISYFDPMTGKPCDSKPKPRSVQRENQKTAIERYEERVKAEAEAAEIMHKMAERKKVSYCRTGRTRPVLVDGVRFESVRAAAQEVGTTPEWLCHVLKNGKAFCKGKRVAFAEVVA